MRWKVIFFLLLICLEKLVTLRGIDTLYIESLKMKFLELVYVVFVFPKSYHSLNLELVCVSYEFENEVLWSCLKFSRE